MYGWGRRREREAWIGRSILMTSMRNTERKLSMEDGVGEGHHDLFGIGMVCCDDVTITMITTTELSSSLWWSPDRHYFYYLAY